VVWARQVASSPWGQHRIRNKKKRAAKNVLHTLINKNFNILLMNSWINHMAM